ncbi:MAG: TonB-dependent receptor [Acidobacteriaceae bacterium]|nr:TonB-dependent receptor [Acidobacteriaceae bacterium]
MRVKDSQEAPVFDVGVQLTSGENKLGPQLTSSEGTSDFANVACGEWTVTASKPGFEDGSANVEIESAINAEVTVVLNPSVVHSSINVEEKAPPVQQASSVQNEVHPAQVTTLPTNPATVGETLPLVPGVVRSPDGQLILDGSGEQRSSLVVNQSDQTDPATGKFGQTVPLDSIDTVNVLNTPFLAQYGRFTQTVVAIDTKRGGEKWHADLNDPFPDFRVRSYHVVGIRNETPRFAVGGPLIANRLYFQSAIVYIIDKVPSRTLGFPRNESKQESINSFTQLDYIASDRQIITATFHLSPQHTNYVNPDYFNTQPTTPTYAQHNYVGTAADHYGLWGGTLDTSLSFQRFDAYVGSQGPGEMVLTPEGLQGNYFATQRRAASRTEWLEIWSPAPLNMLGVHQFKVGSSLTLSANKGQYLFRPVQIKNSSGELVQNISFTSPGTFNRNDTEETAYVQDHWSVTPRVAIDLGLRFENQKLADTVRIAPRAGIAITPFSDGKTVIRGGFGQFYDHIPLDIYTFGRYPIRTITYYDPNTGIPLGPPVTYTDVIGSLTGPRSFLVRGEAISGGFSPRGTTLNFQLEHAFSNSLSFRALYLNNRSVGLIVLEPALLGATPELLMNGDGSSTYRQLELTGRYRMKQGQELIFSYARSRAQGDLNTYDSFVGNFPVSVLRPDIYSALPGDVPNRFLLWGSFKPHIWDLTVAPIIEYRTGFPYANYDVNQNYVGTPDLVRFRNFFSADARLSRVFKVNAKYSVRLSVTGFNITNHFNPLLVHNNTADPQYGTFFGNWHRRYRFDFEVLF